MKRVTKFETARDRQAALLTAGCLRLAALEQESAALEARFAENEAAIAQLEEKLRLRLGARGESVRGMLQLPASREGPSGAGCPAREPAALAAP